MFFELVGTPAAHTGSRVKVTIRKSAGCDQDNTTIVAAAGDLESQKKGLWTHVKHIVEQRVYEPP